MKKTIFIIASIVILALAAVGCGGGGPAGAPTLAPSAGTPGAPAGIDPATAATINGKVNFTGTAPQPKKIAMDAEPTCAAKYAEGPFAENVVVNKDGNTLKNVFVYVKEGLGGKTFPAPQQAVVLDQSGCHYVPHVFGVQAGQTLTIRNSDGILHNIHPKPKTNKEFNIGQPRVMDTNRTFDKPEVMIPVFCEVHGWMNAYVGVLEHPFFAVSGDDGTFTIQGLPPGDYTLEAWHEEYGTQTQKFTVAAKETKTVDLTFKAP
ncbi:MAG: carboxypeptidase regulatory-like domain-containing protein [Chloroflexi bacterium]|nr:carboxypeptidase regulatory-like domain-containing protein [Chloroflexota bacterium]